ncbi:MAG TPA: TrkA family potassium uptake protein [Vicinamibacterales bacterium]|nr:TrkA family potassium uptake protein [Vicinamibacterales bacterium]
MFRLVDPVERALRRRPKLWSWLNRHGRDVGRPADSISGHVVIVGCGRVGRHIAEVLGRIGIPRLVVEIDVTRSKRLQQLGIPVLFGDAANSELLRHAGLERARALVVTVPDDAAALAVVTTARRLAPDLHVITRASTWEGARQLKDAGATSVVRPELEGGIEIVRRTLLGLELPAYDVQRYADAVRRDELGISSARDDRVRVLEDLAHAVGNLDVAWISVAPDSAVAGQTLAQANVRARTGASIVAVGRGQGVISNPAPEEVLRPGDRAAVLGSPLEITEAARLLGGAVDTPRQPLRQA